ncbi:MAG TPA: lipopolysaccharide biosynthesis protein [Streptosporangiaceae bacterium]
MTSSALHVRRRPVPPRGSLADRERSMRRRVRTVWSLLFFDVLGYVGTVLHFPHIFGQAMTQGALPVALLIALTLNRRIAVRPSIFLCLVSLLSVEAVVTALQPQYFGTVYRTFRLAEFVAVLWLLSPWWGRRDMLLVRCHLAFLGVILGSVLLGLLVDPGYAIGSGRLSGALWQIPPTQVAHYAAVMTGLITMLWLCGQLRGQLALPVVVAGLAILLLTHTRTALVALVAGFVVAGLSLIVAKARVRKLFAVIGVLTAIATITASSLITTWLTRGESATQLADLTGRTKVWGPLLAFPRDRFRELFGFGLSNSSFNGLPIDSNWLSSYQEQGLFGATVCAIILAFLLVTAYFQPRGVHRALALFLTTYCLVASFTEDGFTDATPYLLELSLAASLLVPSLVVRRRARTNAGRQELRIDSPAARDKPPIAPPRAPSLVLARELLPLDGISVPPPRRATERKAAGHDASSPLSSKVRRGALWNVLSTLVIRLTSILITAVVAHILAPRDFGVFAVALAAYTIVSNVGELGVASCLMRADLDIDALAPTMVTISVTSAAIFASAMAVFARQIAAAFGSSAAAGPIRVMAIALFLSGVVAVPWAQLTRDFKQDKLFLANVIAFVPSTVVLLFLAKSGGGAMAFAWSRVASQVVMGGVMVAAVPRTYWPGMARSALALLFRFGVPLGAANIVNYTLLNVDYIFIGHLVGAVALGAYVLAFNVASWSASLLGGVINNVSMPAFSRVKHDPDLLKSAVARAVRIVSLILMPIGGLTMALARPLVLTLYGAQWVASADVLAILSLYGVISIICVLFANILTSLGQARLILIVQLLWLAALAPAMAIGVHRDGIVGAALAHIVVIGPLVLPVYLFFLRRAAGVRLATLGRAMLLPLLAAAAAGLTARVASSGLTSPVLALIVGLAAGGLVYAVAAAPQAVALLGEQQATRIRGRLLRSGRRRGALAERPRRPAHARHGSHERVGADLPGRSWFE